MTDDTAVRRVSGSETRQRGRHVAVRCTAAEYATIEAAAAQAGQPVGTYLRAVALGSPGPRAARRPVVNRVVLAQVLGQLGRVGGNVNQLARAFNVDNATPAASELAAIRADVAIMREALMVALGRGD